MDRLALAQRLFLGKVDLSDEVRLGLADALLAWASCPASDRGSPGTVASWRRSLVRLQRLDPRLYPILLRLIESMPQPPRDFAGIAVRLWATLPELLTGFTPSRNSPETEVGVADPTASAKDERDAPARTNGLASPRPRPADVALRSVLWAGEFAGAWAKENARQVVPFVRTACILSALANGVLPDPMPDTADSLQTSPKHRRRAKPAESNSKSSGLWQAFLEHWQGDELGRLALRAAAIGWEIAARLWDSWPGAVTTGRGTARRSRKSSSTKQVSDAVPILSQRPPDDGERDRIAAAEWVAALRSTEPHPVQLALARAERRFRRLRRRIPHAAEMTVRAARFAARLHALEANFAATLEQAKLDAMAEFAAGAGHEINNPLAIIGGHAQVLLRRTQNPEERRILAAITAQVRRAHEMIADARLFARPPRPSLSQIDLRDVLRQVEPPLRELAERYRTTLECRLPAERVEAEADPVQLAAAFLALGKNAVEAAAEGGCVILTLHAGENEAVFEVRDDGPGISPRHRPHIFDPYFSARQAGRGLGLGLPKAWRIAQLHGGDIRVASRPGEETVFTFRLPRHPPSRDKR